MLGGPRDGNKDDRLTVRPLYNPAQGFCSHESIVQGCPVWTANNCRRHGYDTWSPKQDSIAGETVLKTSTGQKDEKEVTAVTGSIGAWHALNDSTIEFVVGRNVRLVSRPSITPCASLSQPEDSSLSPRNSPSASMHTPHRSPLSLIARLKKRATQLASNGDSDVYLHPPMHTPRLTSLQHEGLEPVHNYRGIQLSRILSDCATVTD